MSKMNPRAWLKIIEKNISKASNEKELTKALTHYRVGSEKWEAMLYTLKDTFLRYFIPDEQTDLYVKTDMILDADVITADYLIENVEFAFYARDNFSWAKRLYKKDKMGFFMRVLPYRIGTSKLGQLGPISRHWRAMFLEKSVYNSLKEQLGLQTEFEYIQSTIKQLSNLYETATTRDDRNAVLQQVVAFLDIDIYYNTEGVRYFPRGMGEQTLFNILTLGHTEDSTTPIRGGRCTDLDCLLRLTLMSFGVPVTSMRIPAYATTNDNHEFLWFDWEGQIYNLSPCTHVYFTTQYFTHPYQQIGCSLREDWGDWDQASKIVIDAKVKMPFTIKFYYGTRSVAIATQYFDKVEKLDVTKLVKKQPKGTYVYLGVFNEIDNTLNTQGDPANVAAILVSRATNKIVFNKVDKNDILYFPHTYFERLGLRYVNMIGKPFAVMGNKIVQFSPEPTTGKNFSITLNQHEDQTQANTEYGVYYFKDQGWVLKTTITTDANGITTIDDLKKDVLYVLIGSNWQYLRPWYVNGKGERYIFNGEQQHA